MTPSSSQPISAGMSLPISPPARRGHDVVQFSKTVFDDFADVLAHASQHGQDVVIDAGGGNTLTLKNTSLTALDRTDFHFV